MIAGSVPTGRGLPLGAWLRLPLVYATMHLVVGHRLPASARRAWGVLARRDLLGDEQVDRMRRP